MNLTIPLKDRFSYENLILLLLICCIGGLFFSSCTTPKNAYYFKTLPRDTSINTTVNRLTESVIRKNDQLAINISSLNPDEDKVYNAAVPILGTVVAGGTPSGYLVDMNGNIQLHRLGNIHAEGMTRRELKNKIETDIKPYLRDPVVSVRFLNRRVTVMGEVIKPQVIPMPEEQFSILEALGASGDVNLAGKRDNILIIRETETGKQFKRLNLEDHSVFNSEWYYLKPDDVVYVEPNDKRITEEKRNRTAQNISLAMSGLSLAIIILNSLLK
ncbi:MAG: polysaccharide biosynthesis/export family protein [Ferruginibacter sp.]|nr:polysaccharide biosynthesis/export family protein [Ferruginibacter sp.]